jgi:hypothetical protein
MRYTVIKRKYQDRKIKRQMEEIAKCISFLYLYLLRALNKIA